jgi:SHS2 domain-containing protein
LATSVGYRILPHTTDAYIEAYGATLEEAFAQAGLALFNTMCNADSIEKSTSENIQVKAENEQTLLYNWLENLLLKFELESKVYSDFNVIRINHRGGGLVLDALISGEVYDKNKHGAKVEVKAVTFHRMEIIRDSSGVLLRFILDL